MFNIHWWANLAMQARAMKEDVTVQNREDMDGEAMGEQEKKLGKHKLVLGEHGNGFSFGVFLQGFARLSPLPHCSFLLAPYIGKMPLLSPSK